MPSVTNDEKVASSQQIIFREEKEGGEPRLSPDAFLIYITMYTL
jgi:hypothetical protein